MTGTQHFDLIIIGGGPAGQGAAEFAAFAGRRILVELTLEIQCTNCRGPIFLRTRLEIPSYHCLNSNQLHRRASSLHYFLNQYSIFSSFPNQILSFLLAMS